MTVYFKGEESVCIRHRDLRIKDIGTVCCGDPEITHQVENARLYYFPQEENAKEVFSVVFLLQKMKEINQEIELVNLGETDFIVYYKAKQTDTRWKQKAKIVFVCLVAFFGAAISIMAYNNDVGMDQLLAKVYEWLTGKEHTGPGLLEISYSVGLGAGIIVFFNHAAKKTFSDEPTPFEVQMRLYEKDVNQTFITGAGRKEEEHEGKDG